MASIFQIDQGPSISNFCSENSGCCCWPMTMAHCSNQIMLGRKRKKLGYPFNSTPKKILKKKTLDSRLKTPREFIQWRNCPRIISINIWRDSITSLSANLACEIGRLSNGNISQSNKYHYPWRLQHNQKCQANDKITTWEDHWHNPCEYVCVLSKYPATLHNISKPNRCRIQVDSPFSHTYSRQTQRMYCNIIERWPYNYGQCWCAVHKCLISLIKPA